MSDFLPSGPEIVEFEGSLSSIGSMHANFHDTDISTSFDSFEDGKPINVLWQHDLRRPDGYLYVVRSNDIPKDGFTVYDLVIDESNSFARLYTLKRMGRVAARWTEDNENEWTEFQMETGMVLPNRQDRLSFEAIFKDFCDTPMSLESGYHG